MNLLLHTKENVTLVMKLGSEYSNTDFLSVSSASLLRTRYREELRDGEHKFKEEALC
jgi:hypothetical protein